MADNRPRISARLAAFAELRRKANEQGGDPLPTEHHLVLEDYLRITSLRRADAYPLLRVQLSMLQDLVMAERAVANCKEARTQREKQMSAQNADTDLLRAEIEDIDDEIFRFRALTRAMRDIADGIAWRLFSYDRGTLMALADRPSAGHVELGGIEAELHALIGRVLDEHRSIAVLNDLTNFLKFGDVTSKQPDGTFEMLEVKKDTKTSGRISKQRQGMREVVAFVNDGERERGEIRQVLQLVTVQPANYLNQIKRLCAEASSRGVAADVIGNHLAIVAVDFLAPPKPGNPPLSEERVLAVMAKARTRWRQWEQRGDHVLDLDSWDRAFLPTRDFAPFAIYPIDYVARVRLASGAMRLLAKLNISEVLRQFSSRGWVVTKTPGEHLEDFTAGRADQAWIGTVRKGRYWTKLSTRFLARLGFEALKPRTLIDLCEELAALDEIGTMESFPVFQHEGMMWD